MADTDEEFMARKAGPYYDAPTLAQRLGADESSLPELAAQHKILVVTDEDGIQYFPTRQLTPDGTVIKGLKEVLDTLAAATPLNWTWALWLAGTSQTLSGQTGWDALANGQVDQVLQAAQRAASRWA